MSATLVSPLISLLERLKKSGIERYELSRCGENKAVFSGIPADFALEWWYLGYEHVLFNYTKQGCCKNVCRGKRKQSGTQSTDLFKIFSCMKKQLSGYTNFQTNATHLQSTKVNKKFWSCLIVFSPPVKSSMLNRWHQSIQHIQKWKKPHVIFLKSETITWLYSKSNFRSCFCVSVSLYDVRAK